MTKQSARAALTAAMIATFVIAGASADAANSIPEIFQGHWQPDLDVAASHITETNYECDIGKINPVGLIPFNRIYQIDMTCTTFPPESSQYTQRVKSLRAIRRTSSGDVLVIRSRRYLTRSKSLKGTSGILTMSNKDAAP
jgi:hypothetical protein